MSTSTMDASPGPVLVGNSFPLALIRRRVVIEPRPLAELAAAASRQGVLSFWGHPNTVDLASRILGVDVRPKTARPALTLSPDRLPALEGRAFDECWILSPDYEPGFRPEVGAEVPANKIRGWQVLRMKLAPLP